MSKRDEILAVLGYVIYGALIYGALLTLAVVAHDLDAAHLLIGGLVFTWASYALPLVGMAGSSLQAIFTTISIVTPAVAIGRLLFRLY